MTALTLLLALTLGDTGPTRCGPDGCFPTVPSRQASRAKTTKSTKSKTKSPASKKTATPKAEAAPSVPNFGVDMDKLAGSERYSLNGTDVTQDKARRLIEGRGQVPNDASWPRLTVIGSQADRQKVQEDFRNSPPLAGFRNAVVVQDYDPKDWPVAQSGFVTVGQPTIYFQSPDGKVLHRQDDYADGPEGLATALRRADPGYKPGADPDKRKSPAIDLTHIPPLAWIFGAGALLVLLRRGKA
jgi:hypothetical protein